MDKNTSDNTIRATQRPFLHTSGSWVPVGLGTCLQWSAVNSPGWVDVGGTGTHFSQWSAELAPNPLLQQQHYPACQHCHKCDQSQVLTIASPDSFRTPLRCSMSHFTCTSLNILNISAPDFTLCTQLCAEEPSLAAIQRESSRRRQSLQDLNPKHHRETKASTKWSALQSPLSALSVASH